MQAEIMRDGVLMMTFGANRCLTIKTKKEMKKNLFMVAAVALMALVSCNKEEINNSVVEQPQEEPTVIVEFEAGFDVETKTALDAEGKKTVWKSDDRISINGQEFKVSEIKEDGKAIFVNVNNLPSDFAAPFTAIYPYGSDGSVPAEQDAVAGNFDPKAVIEKATSDNYSLSFKNETSLLKFQVEAACGAVALSSDDDLATGSKTVTINGDFKTGETYYVAVLPGDKTNFAVSIEGCELRSAPKVSINRSSIVNMGNLKNRVRLYINSEKTGFTMNLYGWGLDDVTFDWPGKALNWDDTAKKYYYDFPLSVLNSELGFNINVNGDQCKSSDLKVSLNALDVNYDLNWKWLYLKPNSNWKQASAKFAAYFFTKNVSGEYWQWAMKLDNDTYGCLIPLGNFANVIFCRMSSGATSMGWDNRWNQTGDLTIPTDGKNLFTVPNGAWDGSTSSWSKKTF